MPTSSDIERSVSVERPRVRTELALEILELFSMRGLLDAEAVEAARAAGETDDEQALVERAGLTSVDYALFLAEEFDKPLIQALDTGKIDPEAVTRIRRATARRFGLMPLFIVGGRLIVAVSSARTLALLPSLSQTFGVPIDPVICAEEQITPAIAEFYSDMDELGFEGHLETSPEERHDRRYELVESQQQASGVVELVDLILRQAIDDGVSDIHLDCADTELVLRFRVAGLLRDIKSFPVHLIPEFVSRLKILADLDIAERRLPQDGRIGVTYKSKEIDFRVSTLPTVTGEKVVLRLLDKGKSLVGLDQLGFLPSTKASFTDIITQPHGVLLITGPTGSGKTTTLYAALSSINSRDRNFLTFEDPVEYRLKGINQVQIMPKAGLTFSSGLRASLRQDPDVILVGEIRDKETAEIAFNAALTGHFVLSTFHTNDAPSTIARLRDLGVESFLIATALIGINAQRLVRRICSACRVSHGMDESFRTRIGLPPSACDARLFRGRGCRHCGGTGYRGQMGIFELMPVGEDMRSLITDLRPTSEIQDSARCHGMLTMWEYGILRALSGVTTVEEILRVTCDQQE